MTRAVRRMVLHCALPALLAAGCATKPGMGNFREVMQSQVGKRSVDPDYYPAYYRLRQLDSRRLANGRIEEKYMAGYQGKCELFFEIDPGTSTVVGWRADASDRDCVIENPRRP